MEQSTGFFQALFDTSFSNFITIRIIKFLYIVAIIFIGIGALAQIFISFNESAGMGILFLILAPIIFVLGTILARIYMELIIVLFRIAENTGELVKQGKPGA